MLSFLISKYDFFSGYFSTNLRPQKTLCCVYLIAPSPVDSAWPRGWVRVWPFTPLKVFNFLSWKSMM